MRQAGSPSGRGPADRSPARAALRRALAALLVAAGLAASQAAEPLPADPAARRLTPKDHDADRPAFSADGRRVAYVRSRASGEEIWEAEVGTGSVRRLVASEDLGHVGLGSARYALHDLAFSSSGDRLAFSWSDPSGWREIVLTDPDGGLAPLHAPVMDDPWQEGAVFNLSASGLRWDAGDATGTFIGWDDDCGSLYRVAIPGVGSWGGAPVGGAPVGAPGSGVETRPAPGAPLRLPLLPGCRGALAGTPGYWLYTQLDDDFSQILAIVDGAGREIETVTFPQGRPIEARWADEVPPPGERPPILVWWRDEPGDERRLILWTRDSITEWLREKDAGAAGAVAMVRGSIDLLDGPREGARLMRLAGPETTPIEVLPGPLEDFAVAPGGDRLVAVRAEGGGRSLWILEIGTAPPGS